MSGFHKREKILENFVILLNLCLRRDFQFSLKKCGKIKVYRSTRMRGGGGMGVVGDHPLVTNMEVVGGAHIREARKLDSKKKN